MTAKKPSPKIAAIVVGYNSRKYLDECLGSLQKSSLKPAVYFIDNGTDGSVKYIQKNFPDVTAWNSGSNLGFAAGNNVAVERALADGAEAIFLINPDTVTAPDCLEKLWEHFDETTVVQPLVLLHKDGKATKLVNTWGNPLHYLGFSYAGGNNEPAPKDTEPREIMIGSGCALLIPAGLIKEAGLFDEKFFTYHEDVDTSLRWRIAGAKILCVPAAKVWHKYHFSRNPNKFFFFERNRALTILKNYQWKTILLALPMLVAVELLMLLYSVIGGFFGAKLRAYPSFWALIPHALKERRKVQKLRKVSDKQLYPLWTSQLKFSEVDNAAVKLFNVVSGIYWKIIRPL